MTRTPIFGLRLQVWLKLPNGKRKLIRNRWARSFVQQWIDILYSHFSNSVSLAVKMTNGSTAGNYYAHTVETNQFGFENSSSFGIVVGSGDADVSISDFKLQSQIAHGTGIGQLFYSKCLVSNPTFQETGKKRVEFDREFTNYTGIDVIVREVGIYAREIQNTRYFCLARDIIGSVAIPNGGGIAVKYGLELSL